MDNIMKTLIVVLGISGVLALVVPTQFTPTVPQPEMPGPKAGSEDDGPEAPRKAQPDEPDEPESDDEGDDDGDEDFSDFGKPTIDGKPFDDFGNADNSASDQNSSGQNDAGFEEEGDDATIGSAEAVAQPSRVPAGAPAPRHAGKPAP